MRRDRLSITSTRSRRLASGRCRNESHTEAGTLLWRNSPMHAGQVTSAPTLSSIPDKERYSSTKSVFASAWTRYARDPEHEARKGTA
jgi:hypothetical protein